MFARAVVRDPARRIITRNSFEIYEDQMEALRKLSFQEKMAGQVGSMSAMVRAAIDAYLEEHRAEPTASNSKQPSTDRAARRMATIDVGRDVGCGHLAPAARGAARSAQAM